LETRCLSAVITRTYVAICIWVQKYSDCADRLFKMDKRLVKEIFVDEMLLRIGGHDYWLRIAYEPNLDVCLTMYLSLE